MSADAGAFTAFLEASVRIATPLGLAAVGETITERAGVINIGIEGAVVLLVVALERMRRSDG